jgi:long-chain acyl-CoA synthetase
MEPPWLKEYELCGIPKTLEPYPDVPTHWFVERAAETVPRMVCAQPGLELTYAEIRELSLRLAAALAALGIAKGDRVATLLPTSLQFVLADTAVSMSGAVHVPCSFLEAAEGLGRKFDESSPRALIFLDRYRETAERLREGRDLRLIQARLEDPARARRRGKAADGPYELGELIEEAPPRPPAVEIIPRSDLETLLFTGGTTGTAKGCMLTHRNVVANAVQSPSVFGPLGRAFQGNMWVLLGTPFFHAYGHAMFHTMAQMRFGLLLLPDPRDYRAMLQMVRSYRPMMQVGVPAQFMGVLGQRDKAPRVIGISGSAPLRPDVQERFEQEERGVVTEGYGLSELTAVSHFNVSVLIRVMGGRGMMRFLNATLFSPAGVRLLRASAKALGPRAFARVFLAAVGGLSLLTRRLPAPRRVERRATIGIPLPDTEVKVVDLDDGGPIPLEELSGGERVGEMLVRGPQAMLGYWPLPGSGLDPEGFVHTGDVVRMDREGYFSIVDRTKDMVIVSGFKVYTRELDDVLHRHPASELAASIGMPDPQRPGSEQVIAFVQVKEEYKGKVTEDQFREWLRGKVARYALPRRVIFLEEMPLTEVYKVRKTELRRIAASRLEEEGGAGG